jgi:hypothetical protein
LYADDYPATITDANARLASFMVPNDAYLRFSQAFDFESFGDPYYFDGGVLEYSTDGGSTWLDAGPLINFNGYKGTIYNDWNNPLRGRSAFVGSSHGYISTRLNLASLAGQTVTFRWRMGLDDIGSAWGWWVDNIKVYTCVPVAALLITPSGNIGTNYTPLYTWNKVPGATWYYLWVNGPSGNVIQKWYQATAVCGTSSCSVTPATTLGNGAHTWWIQTWNSGGYGPWSSGMNFSITPVAAAVLVSPNGSIGADYSPAYTWNKVTGATWYYLWVDGPSGNVIKQWYDASLICDASTCSAQPATTLKGGNHTWWIQTWNSAGYGSWSSGMSFSTTILAPPGAATLSSPNGSIGTNYTPLYTWNKVNSATWYYLWVNGLSGKVFAQWYDANIICSGGTCSINPGVTLGGGAHTWWVQTWSSAGYGPWSSGMSFSTTIPTAPGAAILSSPNGSIGNNNPTYTWNKVSGATWYYLWVNGPAGNVIQQWYETSVVCSVSTCSATPAATLASGAHTWWVQTWNSGGYGPWSSPGNFSTP